MVCNTGIESMMPKNVKIRLTVTLTEIYVESLDRLVEEGIYMEYQVAIRAALRLLFLHHRIEPFCSELVEKS